MARGWALGVHGELGWARRQARGSRRGAQVGRRWGAQAGTRAESRALGAQAVGSRRGRHGRVGAGRATGTHGRWARGRCAGARAAIRQCWLATWQRGQLRHGHGCCDTAPVRAAMRGLGVAWALDGCAGWVNWAKLVHCAPGSVLTQFLDPVRLSTVPESLNEHCSLQKKILKKNIF